MQACGRAVKTGRNRNDWRLLIGVPTPRYGAIIIVSRRFRNTAVLGSRFFPCFLRFSLPPPAALPFPSSSSSRILFSSSSSSSLSFSSSSFLLHPSSARKIGAKYCATARHNLISIKFYDCAELRPAKEAAIVST